MSLLVSMISSTSAGSGSYSGSLTVGTDLRVNGKIGVYNTAPQNKPTAYTQTYATADKTHANDTASDMATTGATQTVPWGFASQAQADAIATKFNALRVDVDDLKQLVNAVIDDFQLLGFLS